MVKSLIFDFKMPKIKDYFLWGVMEFFSKWLFYSINCPFLGLNIDSVTSGHTNGAYTGGNYYPLGPKWHCTHFVQPRPRSSNPRFQFLGSQNSPKRGGTAALDFKYKNGSILQSGCF